MNAPLKKLDELSHLAFDGVRTGSPVSQPIEEGAKTNLLCHLGNIAQWTGRALKVDPLSPIINNSLGRTLYYARRYPEAIKQFQKALELEPGFPPAHYNLGSAYAKSERPGS